MNTTAFSQWLQSLGLEEYPWLWEVFIVVLATLVARYIVGLLLHRLERQLEKTANLWDDSLLAAASTPTGALVWLIGFSLVLEILIRQSSAAVFEVLAPARSLLVVLLLAWFLIRVIGQVETRLISDQYTSEPMDATTVLALGKLVRIAVIITSALVILQTLGYSISGVLAFGGVGGIAVGFAAKDLLSNFFGGLMIYLDRPFAVGDWIRSPDKPIEGVVESIGWRQTRIRTFDKRPLYIPNSTFTHISVENPSRMLNRRIFETIGIRYDDATVLKAVVADVKAMMEQHEDLDTDQIILVNFNAFGASSLDFFVYAYTRTTDWKEYHAVKQRVLLAILDIVFAHGADIAYPTSTIRIPDEITLSDAEPDPAAGAGRGEGEVQS